MTITSVSDSQPVKRLRMVAGFVFPEGLMKYIASCKEEKQRSFSNENYSVEIQEKLGAGSYGGVFSVQISRLQSEPVEVFSAAMKVSKLFISESKIEEIENSSKVRRSQEKLEEEISILRSIGRDLHPSIIPMLDSTVFNERAIFFMPICRSSVKQSLKEGRFDLFTVRCYSQQILSALERLHQIEIEGTQGIIHADIKLDNLLIDQADFQRIYLSDFGCSLKGKIQSNEGRRFIGTLDYAAPELILRRPFTSSIDLWSAGVSIFEMYFNHRIFSFKHESHILLPYAIFNGSIKEDFIALDPGKAEWFQPVENEEGLWCAKKDLFIDFINPRKIFNKLLKDEPVFQDFLFSLMKIHPEERVSIEDVLQHPFLKPV